MAYDYDLCVIGAGSGGVRAARMSAQYGARVAIVEEYRVGGTCVIRGCVPKKLFVYASDYAHTLHDAAGFGWDIAAARFNWPRLRDNKDKEIDRLNGIYIDNLKASGVAIFDGRARLAAPHVVEISSAQGTRQLSAARILIASGAQPFRPDISGIEHAITSNEAFHLAQLPDEIIVIGGGYIAVEFAGIFHGLGVKTCLAYRGDKILRGFDEDVRDAVQAAMQARGVEIRLKSDLAGLEKTARGLCAQFKGGEELKAGAVMLATGRVPMSGDLGLEAIGVQTTRGGAIAVDAYSQTNIAHIYAVGDVTNRAQLTPIAIREGAAFAETVFNDNPQAVSHKLIPTAVFSQPEIGTIGLSEAEARADYTVDIYMSAFRPMKHILPNNPEKMLVKLIVDRASDRVLGLHIVGAGAGEMIQAFGVAVTMGATKAQFDATIAVHPTAAEEFVTFKTPLR